VVEDFGGLAAHVRGVLSPSSVSASNIIAIEPRSFCKRGCQAGGHGRIVCRAMGRDVKWATSNDVHMRPSNQLREAMFWWRGEFKCRSKRIADG
jgi:hypothetical protein